MKLGQLAQKPIYTLPVPGKGLVLPYGKVGIEIETERWGGRGEKELAPVWEHHIDNSLRNNGREFTTVGGLVGNEIREAVESFCAWATKHKLSTGYPRAGIHIHLDCTDMNVSNNEPINMIAIYLLMEHALYEFAGPWRRWCGFCDGLVDSKQNVEVLKKFASGELSTAQRFRENLRNFDRYTGLNLQSLTKYGTVEYRHLATTFDSKKILDWINLIFQIKKAAQDWDSKKNFLREFSNVGAERFAEQLMGDQWHLLRPFYNAEQAWVAMDSVCSLTSKPVPPEVDWNPVEPNPILKTKGQVKKPIRKKPKAPKERDVGAEFLAQQARVMPAMNEARRRNLNEMLLRAAAGVQAEQLRVDRQAVGHLTRDEIDNFFNGV